MAENLSKKFALLTCSMMTMQALRLVISTAGFCVVRFHIDCELFNIFISRLVNAVLMSQLFGNWLGDLFVFAFGGKAKLGAASVAFWFELFCFCSALFCIVHTECGHLTGFYWSMVIAYFWWKVAEAPATSIAPLDGSDYWVAGFTLSGVWAAFLKAAVMRCVAGDTKTLNFKSDSLGDVNLKVVGARSVKTTVDYRASKWLFVITIVLTFLMCVSWTAIAAAVDKAGWWLKKVLNDAGVTGDPGTNKITIEVEKEAGVGTQEAQGTVSKDGDDAVSVSWTKEVETATGWTASDKAKVTSVKTVGGSTTEIPGAKELMEPKVTDAGSGAVRITVSVRDGGAVGRWRNADKVVASLAGIAFGGVLAVPGAMLVAGVGWVFAVCFKCCVSASSYAKLTKRCQLIFGIVGALGGMAAGVGPCVKNANEEPKWVEGFKWPWPDHEKEGTKIWAPMMGLAAGMTSGAFTGLCIGACKTKKKEGFWGGALVGSAFGLWSGEIANAVLVETGKAPRGTEKQAPGAGEPGDQRVWQEWAVVVCGFFIVVGGLGTVYSIYPGMAPCSITQFQYFNIIDILILILSSIAPLVIMGVDLAELEWRMAKTIDKAFKPDLGGTIWMVIGLVLLIATNVCEILVLDIMQHPHSKLAKDVTTSGWRAVLLTVTMVTSQLVSTGVGFPCVVAGSAFNDGIMNANSTAVLWATECCGVLGEGYLTELKKYEPGKWPTQGMGKCATYWWWNNKAFSNAWQIWCCIGTTDLRRDIMLCRK